MSQNSWNRLSAKFDTSGDLGKIDPLVADNVVIA